MADKHDVKIESSKHGPSACALVHLPTYIRMHPFIAGLLLEFSQSAEFRNPEKIEQLSLLDT